MCENNSNSHQPSQRLSKRQFPGHTLESLGEQQHILKLGCTWESLGKLSKILMSGPAPRDSDFIGSGMMKATGFFFLKLPGGSQTENGCFYIQHLLLERNHSLGPCSLTSEREREQLPGPRTFMFRGRT